MGAEVEHADSAQPAGGPDGQPDGQLRGDAGRRRAERLRRGDRPASEPDRDLRRLLRRGFGARAAGSATWAPARPKARSTISASGGCSRSRSRPDDFNHRLLSLDGLHSLLSDEPGGPGGDRCGDGLDALGGELPAAGRCVSSANAVERDLNPAVIHDGRVFIAPGDADAIFAFDCPERPAALEVRSNRRRHQARAPAGGCQGTPGGDRQPRGAVRRQDRQAACTPGPTRARRSKASAAGSWPAT